MGKIFWIVLLIALLVIGWSAATQYHLFAMFFGQSSSSLSDADQGDVAMNNTPTHTYGANTYPTTAPKTTTTATASKTPSSLSGAQDQQCSYDQTTSNGRQKWTMYIGAKENKMRLDIEYADGNAGPAHVIALGNTEYMWPDNGSGIGVKTSALGPSKGTEVASYWLSTSILAADAKLGYQCHSWSYDASKFVLPTNIQFIDAPYGRS